MRISPSVLLRFLLLMVAGAANAQAPFPPPALLSAESFEAASAMIGASKPEFSGYLLLDIPEISIEGTINAVAKSELPGTTHLIVLRQYPVVVGRQASADKTSRKPTNLRSPIAAPRTPAAKPPTVFIAARQFKPGEPAQLNIEFEYDRNERFTLLAFAQGRWFGAAREIKLAREVSDRP